MQTDAADQAGIGPCFGRVTDQAGGLVNDKQVWVFMDDVEWLYSPLVIHLRSRIMANVKEKRKLWIAIALMVVFAITRWPGVMPPNFSAAYALVFCAGVYFPRALAWWLPLTTLVVSDVVMNIYYYQTTPIDDRMLVNYLAYAAIIFLGQRFKPRMAWLTLLAGGVAGAVLFYLITNTASWLMDPAYPKTFLGWIQALTVGTPGWPHTWEFFRNTLLSGGLFAGLFAGAMKLGAAEETEEEEEEEAAAEEAAPEPEEAPEESKA
jgi:hypothetical protein